MKKNVWLSLIFMLFFVSACGTSQTSNSGNSTDSSNNSGSSNIGNPTLRIPTINDTPPSGLLEQLTWAGAGGGPRGICDGACGGYVDGNQMILRGFEPNQNITGLLYRYTGGDSCGNVTAEFVTSFAVQVPSSGSVTVELSGNYIDLFVFEIFDRDTGVLLFGSPIGGVYPCP